MKRTTTVLAIILACASVAWGAEPGPLTTIHAIRALSRADAAKGLPVAIEGTVTYYARPDAYGTSDIDLFIQNGNEAIYVETQPNQDLSIGDWVLVRGKTRNSFRTDVVSESVVRLRPGEPPKPLPATYEELIRAERDCMRVTVRATVRSADRVSFGDVPSVDLKLQMDGGTIDATAVGKTAMHLKELLDAEVEVTGVAGGIFDSKNQLTGVVLEIPSLADIKVLKKALTNPEALPVTPMDEVLSARLVEDRTRRVRVQGTITYYQPGAAVVLQNGAKSLWVMTQYEGPLRVGDWADATGFPDVNGASLTLTLAAIQDSQHLSPIAPQPVSGEELASGAEAFNLVSIEGEVLTTAREGAQDEYVLRANGKVFSAIYRHPQIAGADLPHMRMADARSRVRVTGICMLQYGSDPFHGPVAMDVLLRSFDDIVEVANPPLATVRNLGIAASLLLILALLAGARGWNLERRMRQNTAAMAYVEQRRSRILEDINASRPLAEIVEQITELVSFNLKGSPCWCRIVGGAQLGNCPPKLDGFRVIHVEIPSRSGPPLGVLCAALDPLAPPRANETEALHRSAALAALAIETQHIYSDLRHRSEFDLLTDTHNRFSLERNMDLLMEEARQKAGIFGLIYIDLDEFKQINDLYGHQVGDSYLQEVTVRMKRQLRSHDMLARLGGDEFAALVPKVRSRAEVEEIAHRMSRSCDAPFVIGRYTIQGSASVGIALYPEDGVNKDSLLETADSNMYVAKNAARQLD